MAIFKPAQFNQFVRSRDPKIAAILIFGPDRGRVREAAKSLVEAVSGEDDPFNIVHLDDDVLGKDPARLADEAQAISLMGGVRSVWVRDAANGFFGAAKSYLTDPRGDGLIVAEAGDLRKGTGLRSLFEKAKNAACLACYEDGARDVHGLIEEVLGAENLTIGQEARMVLAAYLGGDRALSRAELEKLVLYCRGKDRVEIDDIEQICGDTSSLAVDDLVDAVFGGELTQMDVQLNRLLQSGTLAAPLISSLSTHANRLHKFSLQIESGRSAKQIIDGARPPVFWKRKDAVARQLSIWDSKSLEAAGLTLADAEKQTRQHAALSEAIAGRAFLSLSRRAYGIRIRGN
ncbi:MAG: DNA polymerase III subunit delta [Hyphomicrobiales bacterium]